MQVSDLVVPFRTCGGTAIADAPHTLNKTFTPPRQKTVAVVRGAAAVPKPPHPNKTASAAVEQPIAVPIKGRANPEAVAVAASSPVHAARKPRQGKKTPKGTSSKTSTRLKASAAPKALAARTQNLRSGRYLECEFL